MLSGSRGCMSEASKPYSGPQELLLACVYRQQCQPPRSHPGAPVLAPSCPGPEAWCCCHARLPGSVRRLSQLRGSPAQVPGASLGLRGPFQPQPGREGPTAGKGLAEPRGSRGRPSTGRAWPGPSWPGLAALPRGRCPALFCPQTRPA